MDFLRYGRSPWGERILTHVSWNLFWASLFAGILFFLAHAAYMLFSAHRKRSAAETDALLVLPRRLELLPRGRQYLLRGHADGDQPRARDLRRRPLRGGQPV